MGDLNSSSCDTSGHQLICTSVFSSLGTVAGAGASTGVTVFSGAGCTVSCMGFVSGTFFFSFGFRGSTGYCQSTKTLRITVFTFPSILCIPICIIVTFLFFCWWFRLLVLFSRRWCSFHLWRWIFYLPLLLQGWFC